MLRARVTGQFNDFSVEGDTISEVFQAAEEKLLDGLEGDPPDFTLEWIPEHEPKLDDDVHRWMLAWRENSESDVNLSRLAPKEIIQQMIREYVNNAREGRVLRP